MALTPTQKKVREELDALLRWWLGPLYSGKVEQGLYEARAAREHLDAVPSYRTGQATFNAFERLQDLVKRGGFSSEIEDDILGNWFANKQEPAMRAAYDRVQAHVKKLVADAKEIESQIASGGGSLRKDAQLARSHTEIIRKLGRVASDPYGRYKLQDLSAVAGIDLAREEPHLQPPGTSDQPLVTPEAGNPAADGDVTAGQQADADRLQEQADTGGGTGTAPTPAPGDGVTGAGGGVGAAVPGGGVAGVAGDIEPSQGIRQLPGGSQLWLVDGRHYYLAYTIPGTDVPLLWRVESPQTLRNLFGPSTPMPDRQLSTAELNRMAPWQMGGVSAELAALGEDPFDIFITRFRQAAEIRPWINDPTFLAVAAVAYLEGRKEIGTDELAQTDWWNNHTADERAWMEEAVTIGEAEVQRRLDDSVAAVSRALREAGMNNVPESVSGYIALQRLTGVWSKDKTQEQVRKLADPFAPGTLDEGIRAVLRDPERTEPGDAKALSGGYVPTRDRIRDIFVNARVPIATETETEQERLDRLTREVRSGVRTMGDVRESVDLIAERTPGASPGGLDVTRQGEDEVRSLIAEWVGPQVGQGYDDTFVAKWAGKLRNDPDAQTELVALLQKARLSAFPGWRDPNVSYADLAPQARSLFVNVWGQTPDETDPLFMDAINAADWSEAAKMLRDEGLKRNVAKVEQDMFGGLSTTPVGQQVVRSSI